jgi:polyisoprenoid-binding protein YceI
MTATAPATRLAAGRWSAIVERTSATFTVRNLGLKVVHGSIPVVTGEVEVGDDGRPVRLRAELDLDGIDTGIPRRDADLRKPHLLDIDHHPAMTYTADAIRPGPDGWSADGELQARGTACPLVLTGAAVVGAAPGVVHVRATATLDRTAIGLRAPSLLIGRTVTITIDGWLAGPVAG